MIDIFASSDKVCQTFLQQLLANNNAEVVMEILLEGKDELARSHVSRTIKYLLCRMKIIEKDDIVNDTMEIYIVESVDDEGNQLKEEKHRRKALSL